MIHIEETGHPECGCNTEVCCCCLRRRAAPQEMVAEFHRAFGARVAEAPSNELMNERWHLIVEEFVELMGAWLDLPEPILCFVRVYLQDWQPEPEVSCRRARDIAKELADLVYVTYGAAVNLSIDLDAALARVHANNMAKVGRDGQSYELNHLGKVLKPEGHRPPDLRDCLPEWLRGVAEEEL